MKALVNWMTAPATALMLAVALALTLVATGLRAPASAPANHAREWQPQQRVDQVQPPAMQASGQRIARPQKWVF